jgi:hypothetical protein
MRSPPSNVIPKTACKDRTLYRIRSRNLLLGVFREATGGFLGIREKFGSRFVFEEYHYDNGPPFGTVRPEEELQETLPEAIQNREGLGTACSVCGKPTESHETREAGKIIHGWWAHVDGTKCEDMHGVHVSNAALFTWLEAMEKKYVPENAERRR